MTTMEPTRASGRAQSRLAQAIGQGPAMNWTRITVEPGKMGGRACIRGLRMPVATVVRMVASRMTFEQIIEAHPELEPADIVDALEYAAGRAN
jgi:uncharacterized protein (DUF433 family)